METRQMNRFGQRPYNRTCGMMNQPGSNPPCENSSLRKESCACKMNSSAENLSMYEHLKHLVPAMAYVPYQQFTSAYDLDYALSVGTIFPELCKPFCGKRGVKK